MPKLSKPIQWTLILSIFAVAVVYLLPNNQPTSSSHHSAHRTAKATTGDDGLTYADLNTTFPHYKGGARDPFVPLVTPPAAQTQVGAIPTVPIASQVPTTGWALTGINTIDGVTEALVENSATGASDYLHVGDAWLGMTVKAIEPDGIVLVGPTGQPTRLSFALNAPAAATPSAPLVPGAPGAPSISSVTPLPPMPLAATGRRGRRNRLQGNVATTADDSSESSSE